MTTSLASVDLADDLARLEAIAMSPVATSAELARNFTEIYAAVARVDLSRYDPVDVRRRAGELTRRINSARLRVRERIPEWASRGLLTHDAQLALRNALRASRYASDMIGELSIDYERLAPGQSVDRAFSEGSGSTFVNPLHAPLDFRSGDVLLVRGRAHNSAAIARVGDVDSQFSHLAIIHVDKAGNASVVEALIEDGATINTLDYALDHGIGRAVLFRHRDGELARRAAEAIHGHVLKTLKGAAPHIAYDFSMTLADYKELFCSKLVRLAYALASDRQYLLPTFKTRFDLKNRDFIDRIGVTALESFAPADIELEPGFNLIAEWQDYRITSDLRLNDLIMTRLFAWMEEDGWRFKSDLPVRLIGWFGRGASHLSETTKKLIQSVVPRVPDNMSRSTISAVAMLHQTAEPLLKALREEELRKIAATGRPLQLSEVFGYLDAHRAQSGGRVGYLVAPRKGRG